MAKLVTVIMQGNNCFWWRERKLLLASRIWRTESIKGYPKNQFIYLGTKYSIYILSQLFLRPLLFFGREVTNYKPETIPCLPKFFVFQAFSTRQLRIFASRFHNFCRKAGLSLKKCRKKTIYPAAKKSYIRLISAKYIETAWHNPAKSYQAAFILKNCGYYPNFHL